MVKPKAILLCIFFIIALLLPVSAATLKAPTDRSETEPRLALASKTDPVNASRMVGTTPETDFVFSDGTIVRYIGTDTIVDIPAEIGGEKVLHIGDSAFNNTNVVSVLIPEGVTDIGDFAFHNCTSLSYVAIPGTVTVIYSYAFDNCIALTSITLPENLKVIGDCAFMGCRSLTSIMIPNSVVYMGYGAFYYCTELRNAVLSDQLTRIEDDSFGNCTSLKSIVLPDSVTYVGYGAFDGCEAAENLTLSKNLTFIGKNAFNHLVNITSIEIPDSVTYIDNSAFLNNENVESIKLPNTLTYIGYFAFAGCTSLKSIAIPSDVICLEDSAFNDVGSLESAYFLGNAPAYWGNEVFEGVAPGFTIYYLSQSTGFTTPTFRDYPSVCQYKVGILDTTGGTITADEDWATSGKTVTLTVTPGAGYITSSVYYTDIYGTHAVTGSSFVMPDSDVEVGAVFSLSVTSWILIIVMTVLLIGMVFYLARPIWPNPRP